MKQPKLFMAIGPSGSGKSTYCKKLQNVILDLQVFSLDALRHEFYDPVDYRNAFFMSTKDTKFSARANKRFIEIVETGKDIYVDNINISVKSRKFYLKEAAKRGYKTYAIIFNVDVETLVARQLTRHDKTVPEDIVRRQHNSVQPVAEGEFDIVCTDHVLLLETINVV